MSGDDGISIGLPKRFNVNTAFHVLQLIVVAAFFVGQIYPSLNQLARTLDELKGQASGLGQQIQSINVSIGQHDVEIRNLKDAIASLQRQARLGASSRETGIYGVVPPEYRVPNGAGGEKK